MSWRARVGIVFPDNSDCDDDYYAMAPAGVTVHMSRNDAPFLEHPVASHTAHLERGYIEQAARQLAPIHCNAVGYASVSCSFAGGPEYDRRIIATIEVGLPVRLAGTGGVSDRNDLGRLDRDHQRGVRHGAVTSCCPSTPAGRGASP